MRINWRHGVLACLCATLALSGCGGSGSNGSAGGDEESAVAPGASAAVDGTAEQGETTANQATIVPGREGEPDRLMIDRFTFIPPEGWTMRGVRDVEVLRIFEKGDSSDPDARITLYRRRAASPDLNANARAYAETWGGAIQRVDLDLGGTEARLISRDHPGDGLQIVSAVLARWFVEDFIVQGEARPGVEVEDAVTGLVESWRWMGGG